MSKGGGIVSDQPAVIMRTVVLLLIMGIVDLSTSQYYSHFQWLSHLRGRRRHAGLWAKDVDCPLECDCPSSFPTAMYCHGRNLQHVPYVPSHVKYIYLQRNQITGIQDGVFDNATNLVWVVLFHNQLSSDKIGKNVFSKLKHLDRLLLDHNELTRVPPNLPKSVTDLRLGHNKITKILSSSFEGMANLTTLQLQANVIEDVGGVFKGLKSLTMLDMRKNKLKKIPDNLPEKLQQLYLEFNNIESVPPGFLTPKLQFVRLAHNKLTDKGLPSNVFNISTLVELDLSFNKLEKIPVVSRNLENLYLHANKIKEFSLSSFCDTVDMTNFSRLRMLRLDANEISAKDIPAEAAYCLRHVAFIDV
ncbi:fibromodulin isoform X2 [Epinephelus moara]|uniref:fibromodulin isoform X2 n=1 Tax=Epinephelus moara TaxID=300413 RepID=UPI00214F2A0C|nr:fibromodulin isoform X2 [Epinephelus moara]